MFQYINTYSFEGDLSATLNSLTNLENTDLSLDSLSKVNYTQPFVNPSNPNESPIRPNSQNQLILKNQQMSWWVENLNSGAIYYFPYTNYVNWAYKSELDTVEIHIDIEISDLIIPNELSSSSKNTLEYKDKFGMKRVITMTK